MKTDELRPSVKGWTAGRCDRVICMVMTVNKSHAKLTSYPLWETFRNTYVIKHSEQTIVFSNHPQCYLSTQQSRLRKRNIKWWDKVVCMEMDVNKPCDKPASHAVSFLSAPDILVTYSVLTTLFRRRIQSPLHISLLGFHSIANFIYFNALSVQMYVCKLN